MTEIERKFLVKNAAFVALAERSVRMIQGYLNSDIERTVRVRIQGEKAYITVKGAPNETGMTRFEWEKQISVADAMALLELCEPGVIEKDRFLVKHGSHVYEVDQFYGDNKGLILAEIELNSETEAIERPEWLGEEVTGDERYYNSQLIKKPFITWKN